MSAASGPPPEELTRRRHADAGGSPPGRDTTPAVGRRGEPGVWRRAAERAAVAFHLPGFADARWSYLYGADTRYRGTPTAGGEDGDDAGARAAASAPGAAAVADAARRMRGGGPQAVSPADVHGPFLHPAVWTWEVPLYFWCGGIASGSSFVALAADLAGDRATARLARRVTLAAAAPAAPLLVSDLGRPGRFLNMLRIFKPRSPMSLGAWCLAAFSGTAAGAVLADERGRPGAARAAGAATAALGTYLGSYTGVLLAATAVPVWARSRALLPPVFVATATATGAAANRLALAATDADGRRGAPARSAAHALATVEAAAMTAELALSHLNERRLGPAGRALDDGRAGRLFRAGKWAAWAGLGLRLAGARTGPAASHAASALFLGAGLAFRFAWVAAGRTSATDDETVAATARAGGA